MIQDNIYLHKERLDEFALIGSNDQRSHLSFDLIALRCWEMLGLMNLPCVIPYLCLFINYVWAMTGSSITLELSM